MKSFNKLREACWKGYKSVGNKKKGDRLVPNCVPEEVEVNEITQKLAGNYLSTVTKQQLSKHGMQPDMYGKLSKNRQQGVSNAFKRLQVDKEGKPVHHLVTKEEHIDDHFVTKKQHIGDHLVDEAVDKKDTVTVDIPLLIRLLEHAREDIKSDADLHRVVEKLISIRNNGVLTMADYDTVVSIKEEVEQIQEIGDTEKGRETLKDYRQKANLQKTYTMMRPSAPDALKDRQWKNRNVGTSQATKRLGEDGIVVPGPTNTTGSGAVAGMGQPPGSKSGEPGVHPMRKKKVVLLPMGRRTPPKM